MKEKAMELNQNRQPEKSQPVKIKPIKILMNLAQKLTDTNQITQIPPILQPLSQKEIQKDQNFKSIKKIMGYSILVTLPEKAYLKLEVKIDVNDPENSLSFKEDYYNPNDSGNFQRGTFEDCACMTVSLSEMKKRQITNHKQLERGLHRVCMQWKRCKGVDYGPHFTICFLF